MSNIVISVIFLSPPDCFLHQTCSEGLAYPKLDYVVPGPTFVLIYRYRCLSSEKTSIMSISDPGGFKLKCRIGI